MKKINKNIKIEDILYYPDYMHTILRVLIGKEQEIATIPYGIADKFFYKNYGNKLIITVVVTSYGASSFSQDIQLYNLNLK